MLHLRDFTDLGERENKKPKLIDNKEKEGVEKKIWEREEFREINIPTNETVNIPKLPSSMTKFPPIKSSLQNNTPVFYKEDSATNDSDKKFNPYSKLINRNRRVRKGKNTISKNEGGRFCGWCASTSTPEWRNGPGTTTLCNACGLQYRNQLKMEQEDKRKNSIKNLLN